MFSGMTYLFILSVITPLMFAFYRCVISAIICILKAFLGDLMEIKTWHPDMTLEQQKDLGYWERNVLALRYAQGWYFDLISEPGDGPEKAIKMVPRYEGWDRVISLEDGSITFHVPNDFDLGDLPEIPANWDGHSTIEKWTRILKEAGVK
jgi:hypothetical protein